MSAITLPPFSGGQPEKPPTLPSSDLAYSHAVRYPLPVLLAELQLERRTGAFAHDKLDQTEIKKLFQPARRRKRGKAAGSSSE